MISQSELKILFKTFGDEIKRKCKRLDFDPALIQHWFKPVIPIYLHCGLRRNEVGYDSEIDY